MPWGTLHGHDEVVNRLRQALAQGRLPHALLFVGPEGVGKHTFATRLAQTLLCEKNPETRFEPCGACPACHQVQAGTHPDLLSVSRPEDKHELPIEAIRKLNLELARKPMRGRRRVAIVDDADDLSEEAANAFLKTLEEPPPGSVLILVGTSPELQLDTIRSRCRVVRFEPLETTDLAQILEREGVVDSPDEARRLAARAEGSVGRALGLTDPELAPFRRTMLDAVSSPRGCDPITLARDLDEFCKKAGKESTQVRARAALLVGELIRFFRGVLRASAGRDVPSADPADRAGVEFLASRLDPDAAVDLVLRCLDADYHVTRRGNLGMIFESLTHDLAHLINRPGAGS